jgi:hypothetical protein
MWWSKDFEADFPEGTRITGRPVPANPISGNSGEWRNEFAEIRKLEDAGLIYVDEFTRYDDDARRRATERNNRLKRERKLARQ